MERRIHTSKRDPWASNFPTIKTVLPSQPRPALPHSPSLNPLPKPRPKNSRRATPRAAAVEEKRLAKLAAFAAKREEQRQAAAAARAAKEAAKLEALNRIIISEEEAAAAKKAERDARADHQDQRQGRQRPNAPKPPLPLAGRSQATAKPARVRGALAR